MTANYPQASTSSAPSASPIRLSTPPLSVPPRPVAFKHRRTCSASTIHIQTQFSRQQTIPASHGVQDTHNPRFSQLFSTALGSPFLTTSDVTQTPSHFSLEENTLHARAPSPSPTADYSIIDAEEADTDMPPIARIPGSYPYGHRRAMSSSFAGLTLHSSSAWPIQRGRVYYTAPGGNGSPFTSFNHPTESVSMPNMSHHTNPFKTLLPRIWDVISSPGRSVFSGVNHNTSPSLSPSPSVNSSPDGSPYPHSISLPTGCFGSHPPSGRQSPLWSNLSRNETTHNGKGKAPVNSSPYSLFASEPRNDLDYSELPPLDGEEGELIDDEACFVDVRAITGVDILALLPPEVALHILQLICPPPNHRKNAYDPSSKLDPLCNEAEEESTASLRAMIACLGVSHTWRRLANDNSVWHTLFLGRWDVDLAKADLSHVRKSGTVFSATKPPSLRQRPKKYKWKFKNRTAAFKFGSPTKHIQPPRSSIVQDNPLQATSVSHPNYKFPLQFDWKQMYQDRLELEKRWRGIAYTHAQIPFCTDEESSVDCETGRNIATQGGLRSRSLSPTLFLGGNMNLSASTGAIDHMVEGPSFNTKTMHGSRSELRPMSVSQTEPANLHASIFAEEKWEPKAMELKGHTDSVYCVEFDSQRIITGSRDRSIMVWSLKTGKLLGSFVGAHRGSVLCLKFEKDWELKTEMGPDNEVSCHENDQVSAAKRAEKSGFMVSGSSDCTVCVWKLEMGEFLEGPFGEEDRDREARGEPVAVLKGHTGGVLDLRIDDKWIVSCSKDTVIRVWDRKTLTLQRMLRGHEGPVNALGLQDGRVVSASGDGKMILWDIESGERLKTFEGHDRGLACIEFKDHLIVSGSNDCKIRIWNAWTGECLKTIAGHNALVRALSFDPKTGRLVSASYDKVVKVWDLYSGKLLWEFTHTHTSHIFDVKFDVGRVVSTSHDQKICVLDFTPGLNASVFV